MISAIIYDGIQKEMKFISDSVRDIIAAGCEEMSRVDACCHYNEFMGIVERSDLEDFFCLDICGKGGTAMAEQIRQKYPNAHILLIADASIAPDQYILPSIMASALILRPCGKEAIRSRLESFMDSILSSRKSSEENIFCFETKDGITKISYSQIYFYEARRKKIYIRLRSEEYSYYNTLEQLEEELPENFVRCHRSYIVNKRRITQYIASENMLRLDDGSVIPVSRSYRKWIREWIK